MPHRATYFFPRQFPEKRLDESSNKSLDHEKKKLAVNSTDATCCIENDIVTATSASNIKDDVVFSPAKNSAVSDFLSSGNKFRCEQKQIAAFCDWLVDKRHTHHSHHAHHSHHHHRRRHHRHHHHRHRSDQCLPEDEPLLLDLHAEKDVVAVDRSFDREVSLPRLSSGSSYAASLFASDVTVTATFSSDDITKEDTTSSFHVSTNEAKRRNEQQKEEEEPHEEEEKCREENYAKYKESYELQLAVAKRLSFLSSFGSEPVLTFDTGLETWDVESVSRRLWV